MGVIFGKGANINTSTQRISSFQVNQSSYGVPLKLIFGTAMVNSVLIDFQDFTSIAHVTTTRSGGKGGHKTTQTSTTYTYTVAGCIALGEGKLAGVGQVWSGSKTTDLYSLNLEFFNGEKAQAPWGYMLTKHPDHALTYSGTSYLAGVVDLGESGSLPNMNFEVYGLCQSQAPTMYKNADYYYTVDMENDYTKEWIPEHSDDEGTTPAHWAYRLDITLTLEGYVSLNNITSNRWSNTSSFGQLVSRLGLNYTITEHGDGTASIHIYQLFATPLKRYTWVNVNYKAVYQEGVGIPTNQKMQQYAYNKEIEISNFQANRYVEEYVFDSLSGTGSWKILDSRYYTIEQSKDQYGNVKAGVYTYTFNFDDRSDGMARVDPTYVRIYYTAIQATVDYTPTDANPRDIIYTLLTSTVYGENFPDVLIDEESLNTYSTYCKNNSLLLSPVYDDQNSCSDIIDGLMECTNSAYVFSQGKVKIVPYWDGLTPNYAISDRNIINQTDETLRIERTSQADTYNIVPLEHTSRADQYNTNVVYATDEGDIELHGVRQAGTYSHPEIMNQSLAQAVAQIILQKQLYNRNKYTVKLGQEFILLEPMDAVTLESELAKLGITSVRVVEIVESADDYTLEITFEDNLSGVTTAPAYATQASDRAVSDTNAEPGNANVPIMFEAPAPLVESATGYELWIYASGGNKWWGGCNVWISTDGESYRLMGSINQPARQGVITNSLPSHATPDEDNTLGVDLTLSRSNLAGATRQEADDYVTLCWIDGNNNGEFISYQNAELTGLYQYDLSYLRRGVYGSNIMTHTADAKFVRCDSEIMLKLPFNTTEIGNTYYVKLVSFNVFGTVEQELSEVEPYTITLHGYNKKSVTESGTDTLTIGVTKTISYNHTYQSAPYPQVQIINGYAGDVVHITNMTTTSFDVVFNNDDTSIEAQTRDINYIVYGI